jgi:hypothetical protein
VRARGWRGILGGETSNEGMWRVGIRGKSGECGRMLKEVDGPRIASKEEAR